MEAIGSVTIIGTGNVASHLGTAFFEKGIRIDGVVGRNIRETEELCSVWNAHNIKDPSDIDSDLALICVHDDSIEEVVLKIPSHVKIAYTSGSVPLSSFSARGSIGVFYPLQTFSKNKPVDVFQVPFLIEANTEIFAQELFDLAGKISRHVVFADSDTRRIYHLAAVWVNNFTNHMAYKACEILENHQLDFKLLLPLLNETVNKLSELDPYSAQTGPARRGDLQTIQKHEQMQEGIQQELYRLITRSIIETYKNEKL